MASFKGSRRPICPACSLRSTSAVQRSSALRPDLPSTHAVPLFKIACSSESAMRVRIVLYWKVTRGNKVYRNIKATIPPYSAASSSSAVAPFENFRPRCAARCFLTQLRRPSVREEAPSPPIGLDPAFPRTQTILKRGGNMRFKDGGIRISSSVLPIQFRVVSRLSVLHPGEASSGRVPPSLLLSALRPPQLKGG